MGNDVSLINDCHFYTQEKRPIEVYLEYFVDNNHAAIQYQNWPARITIKGIFIFVDDKNKRKLKWLDERYCFNGGKQ